MPKVHFEPPSCRQIVLPGVCAHANSSDTGKNSDVAILPFKELDEKLANAIKPSRNKKVLNFNAEGDDLTDIMELYNNLAGK